MFEEPLTWFPGRDVAAPGELPQVPDQQADQLENLRHHDDGDAEVEGHGAAQAADERVTLQVGEERRRVSWLIHAQLELVFYGDHHNHHHQVY